MLLLLGIGALVVGDNENGTGGTGAVAPSALAQGGDPALAAALGLGGVPGVGGVPGGTAGDGAGSAPQSPLTVAGLAASFPGITGAQQVTGDPWAQSATPLFAAGTGQATDQQAAPPAVQVVQGGDTSAGQQVVQGGDTSAGQQVVQGGDTSAGTG
jgi:hypothetical protein